MKDLITLRVALLTRENPADPETANAFQMRRYATILLEALSLNEARIGELVIDHRSGLPRRSAGRDRLGPVQVADDDAVGGQALGEDQPELGDGVRAVADLDRDSGGQRRAAAPPAWWPPPAPAAG